MRELGLRVTRPYTKSCGVADGTEADGCHNLSFITGAFTSQNDEGKSATMLYDELDGECTCPTCGRADTKGPKRGSLWQDADFSSLLWLSQGASEAAVVVL